MGVSDFFHLCQDLFLFPRGCRIVLGLELVEHFDVALGVFDLGSRTLSFIVFLIELFEEPIDELEQTHIDSHESEEEHEHNAEEVRMD